MRDRFGCQVGFSDHTEGLLGSLVATSLGAKVIEKHFTLSRDLPGPDHRASLDPKQLKEFVQQIRLVERALGQGHKEPTQSEAENIPLVRKYIVAARDLAQGKVLNVDDLTFKRSGGGLEPKLLWEIVGQKSNRAYQKDEPIEW